MIKHTRQSFYNNKVQNLRKSDPANWHKELKSMANIGKTNMTINIEGIPAGNNKAIADIINNTLSNITSSLPPLDTSRLPAYLPASQPPKVMVWDMYHKLRHIRIRKAAGPDNVTARLIKEYAYELSQPLTLIMNSSLAEGRVPQEWHEATVIPLPKTNPPTLNDLRPISLTSLLAKICESFIAKWILTDITPHLDPRQFGGILGRPTTHCLVDILNQLYKTSDQRDTVSSLVLTDFAKAFDRVDHTTAISSLIDLGCRPSLLPWLGDFLTGRKQRTRYQDTLSEWRTLTCGLPQGTVLAPIVFIAIINSAASTSRSLHWKFVDDLNMVESRSVKAQSNLQQDLNALNLWSSTNHMKVHPNKCKVMHFVFRRTPPPLPPLQLAGHVLQEVTAAKLLGVWVQRDLKWDSHVTHMVKQSSKRLFILRRLKKFKIPETDLVTVYTCYVRPLCEYAVPVWNPGLTKLQSTRLETVQRRACRTILGKKYTCYSEALTVLGLSTLETRRELLCMKFGLSLLNSASFRHWLPQSRGDVIGQKTRTSHKLNFSAALIYVPAQKHERSPSGSRQEPARDLTAARPNCKSRSAPYHTPHGSRRETDRAPDGSLTETGRKIRRTLGVMTPAGVYAEDMPNGRRFKCDLSII
ncbi:hypothetical protein Bbelb_027890 [Branchiostoma belcheri]|nr:hypothetical protein Bbelb_027890 [Branchiostoma belcheri]